jgi:FkbM family methyltransferase
VHFTPALERAAADYVESVLAQAASSGKPAGLVLIHYQGNTSMDQKNLTHDLVRRVCDHVLGLGHVPVILDWDRRSPLPDNRRIYCPDADHPLWGHTGTGDAGALAALISRARLFIGIDSGPLHVAAATSTPTIAVWTGHHPIHYLSPADNVVNLVPHDHARLIRPPEADRALEYFSTHYRFRTYVDLEGNLLASLQQHLLPPSAPLPLHPSDTLPLCPSGTLPLSPSPPLPLSPTAPLPLTPHPSPLAPPLLFHRRFWIRADNVDQDLTVIQDVYERDAYRTDLQLDRIKSARLVIDVGAHVGAFARRVHEINPTARIYCVEACPENLPVLQANVGDFAEVIHAACTYEAGPMALKSAVRPHCISTGGSVVLPLADLTDDALAEPGYEYWHDRRPLPKVTLEDLLARSGEPVIHLLKLDCEGSEYSILSGTRSLERIAFIMGEYHGQSRWDDFRRRVLAGWDYGHMSMANDMGTFHYRNPRLPIPAPPTPTLPHSATLPLCHFATRPLKPLAAPSSFWSQFEAIVHPSDRPTPDTWRLYYGTLYEIVRRLAPRRITEIGVRAGYSAFTMLHASPGASYLGIEADLDETRENTHAGRSGLYRHALHILDGLSARIVIADSHALRALPASDLVYIDGDHTFEGCLADLRLAAVSTNLILVDDYHSIPTVRQACEVFLSERSSAAIDEIENGLTGQLLVSLADG